MAEPPTPSKSVELRPKAVLNHPDVVLGFPKQLTIHNTNTDSVGSMLRLKRFAAHIRLYFSGSKHPKRYRKPRKG